MLSFFRRIIKSRLGILVTLAALGLIALAFGLGDITGFGFNKQGLASGDTAVTVGSRTITEQEITERAQLMLQDARTRNPNADMAQFLAAGQLDRAISDLVDAAALDEFGARNGITVSKRAIDGEIASSPFFHGPDGKFDQKVYLQQLAKAKITDAQIRSEIRRQLIARWMLGSIIGGGEQHVPIGLAMPYASLQLERRQGIVAFVPTSAMNTGATPDDKVLTQYYQSHIRDYTVPARRALRYATVTPAQVAAQAAPTEAQIAQAYREAGSRFAATEKRKLSQVIVADQAAAATIAKSTKPLAAAAQEAGLAATPFDAIEKADYAKRVSPAIAEAVFAAKQGATVGPIRSPLGYYVVRVETVTAVPAKTLEQAKPELVDELTKLATADAMTKTRESLDEGLDKQETFDQLAARGKLQARETPALLPNGVNPDDPKAQPDPALAPILRAGFLVEPGDQPQLVPISQDGSYALVTLKSVVPATPRPFATVRADVLRDYMVDQGLKAAHKAAQSIVDNVQRGAPFAQAIAASGAKIPAPQPVDKTRREVEEIRAQLAQNRQPLPAPLAMLFSMAQKKAKLIEAPNRGGYFVVYLDAIQPGDATGKQDVIDATRGRLGQLVGPEYAQQFMQAVRKSVEVKRNEAAIGRVRAQLAGQAN